MTISIMLIVMAIIAVNANVIRLAFLSFNIRIIYHFNSTKSIGISNFYEPDISFNI